MQALLRPPVATHDTTSGWTPVRIRGKEQLVSQQPSRSASHSRSFNRSHRSKQDLTWGDRARKSPSTSAQQAANHNNDDLRALREELSRLTALTQCSLALVLTLCHFLHPPLKRKLSTTSDLPPSKEQRMDTPNPFWFNRP
ncbi:hypothetical protein MRX96_042879 [Rhipicephalus microplus]